MSDDEINGIFDTVKVGTLIAVAIVLKWCWYSYQEMCALGNLDWVGCQFDTATIAIFLAQSVDACLGNVVTNGINHIAELGEQRLSHVPDT